MAHQPTESKRLLSYTIAEWACGLKYQHLSPEAIQAAKLFWFVLSLTKKLALPSPSYRDLHNGTRLDFSLDYFRPIYFKS